MTIIPTITVLLENIFFIFSIFIILSILIIPIILPLIWIINLVEILYDQIFYIRRYYDQSSILIQYYNRWTFITILALLIIFLIYYLFLYILYMDLYSLIFTPSVIETPSLMGYISSYFKT